MATTTRSRVTDAEVEDYHRDGVACIRGLFDGPWIARMLAAIDRVEHNPGPFRERYTPDSPGLFFSEKFMWTFDPDFRAFVYESPAAETAGQLMQSRKINFFYDHLMVKEPGTTAPTPWHQDLNYWPAEGTQVCSIWLALDPVNADNGGLEFVRGSHRWSHRFRPFDFRGTGAVETDEFEPLPDIESNRPSYDIVAWDLAAGDVVVFNALTLHAATGNRTAGRRRRALSTRWTGDDVRFVHRKKTIKLIRDPGLKPGDPMDSELFPIVWRRPA